MRRTIDILVSLAVLLLLAPLLAAIGAAVAVDSPGSPLYLAPRAGRNGRLFLMFKFRTMIPGAAAMGSITGPGDRRVTRLGRLLRRTKLDELPQFLNVLLGRMTLVGPRPESPDMVARYAPHQIAVLAVKPGVTGKVQLEFSGESDAIPVGVAPDDYYATRLLDRKIRCDLEYIQARTVASDLRILLQTAALVLGSALRSAPAVRLPGGSRT